MAVTWRPHDGHMAATWRPHGGHMAADPHERGLPADPHLAQRVVVAGHAYVPLGRTVGGGGGHALRGRQQLQRAGQGAKRLWERLDRRRALHRVEELRKLGERDAAVAVDVGEQHQLRGHSIDGAARVVLKDPPRVRAGHLPRVLVRRQLLHDRPCQLREQGDGLVGGERARLAHVEPFEGEPHGLALLLRAARQRVRHRVVA